MNHTFCPIPLIEMILPSLKWLFLLKFLILEGIISILPLLKGFLWSSLREKIPLSFLYLSDSSLHFRISLKHFEKYLSYPYPHPPHWRLRHKKHVDWKISQYFSDINFEVSILMPRLYVDIFLLLSFTCVFHYIWAGANLPCIEHNFCTEWCLIHLYFPVLYISLSSRYILIYHIVSNA